MNPFSKRNQPVPPIIIWPATVSEKKASGGVFEMGFINQLDLIDLQIRFFRYLNYFKTNMQICNRNLLLSKDYIPKIRSLLNPG
jgi:hypothetical protein